MCQTHSSVERTSSCLSVSSTIFLSSEYRVSARHRITEMKDRQGKGRCEPVGAALDAPSSDSRPLAMRSPVRRMARFGRATTRREVSMQMQEYIYLRTTPMYFLGASGRIVGSNRKPSRVAAHRCSTAAFPLEQLRGKRRRATHRWPTRSDTPEIYEQTSHGPQG